MTKISSDYLIRKAIKSFYEWTQQIIEDDMTKPAWKVWFSSPAAWLTFCVSRFNEDELKRATEICSRAKAGEKNIHFHYVNNLIAYIQANPTTEMLTLKQMYQLYGTIDFVEEDLDTTIAEGYAREAQMSHED